MLKMLQYPQTKIWASVQNVSILPICILLCMLYFKKYEEGFKQLALEMCAGNPKLIELKAVEVDIKTAIY